MATENKRINVNPLLWTTADLTFVPNSGEVWYYDYYGTILPIYGDGTSTVDELRDEDGAEFKTVSGVGSNSPRLSFSKADDNSVNLTFAWDCIPKQASGMTLLYTSLVLYEYNLSLRTYAFDGSEILGAPVIQGNEVSVQITNPGAFANYTNAGNTVRVNNLTATLT